MLRPLSKGGRSNPSRTSRCGSLLPPASADVCSSDDVIAFEGHIYRMGPGVLAAACKDCTIAHNEIHHFYYTAISTGYGFKSGHVNTRTHALVLARSPRPLPR